MIRSDDSVVVLKFKLMGPGSLFKLEGSAYYLLIVIQGAGDNSEVGALFHVRVGGKSAT